MSGTARAAKTGEEQWRVRRALAGLCLRIRRRLRGMPGLNEGFVIKD